MSQAMLNHPQIGLAEDFSEISFDMASAGSSLFFWCRVRDHAHPRDSAKKIEKSQQVKKSQF